MARRYSAYGGLGVSEAAQTAEFWRRFKGLYLIRHPDAPRIKIGVSGDPASRLAAYPSAWGRDFAYEPTIVLAEHLCFLGARKAEEIEKAIHWKFREHRLQGEWFTLTPELEAVESAALLLTGTLDESICVEVLTSFAEAIGWPLDRLRIKRNETGDVLLASGGNWPGQSPRWRRLRYTPSRGVSPKV